jgi:hypothetical protein
LVFSSPGCVSSSSSSKKAATMRGLKGSSKTGGTKQQQQQQQASAAATAGSARSASHGSSKALLGVDALMDEIKYDLPPKVSTSAAPSPRSTASGAASPVPTTHGSGSGGDPDTPKSRLLHSVMGALEAYASSATGSDGNPPHPAMHLQQQPYHHQHHHHHQQQPPSSASSSPARARSGMDVGSMSTR